MFDLERKLLLTWGGWSMATEISKYRKEKTTKKKDPRDLTKVNLDVYQCPRLIAEKSLNPSHSL